MSMAGAALGESQFLPSSVTIFVRGPHSCRVTCAALWTYCLVLLLRPAVEGAVFDIFVRPSRV